MTTLTNENWQNSSFKTNENLKKWKQSIFCSTYHPLVHHLSFISLATLAFFQIFKLLNSFKFLFPPGHRLFPLPSHTTSSQLRSRLFHTHLTFHCACLAQLKSVYLINGCDAFLDFSTRGILWVSWSLQCPTWLLLVGELMRRLRSMCREGGGKPGIVIKKQERRELEMRGSATTPRQTPQRKGWKSAHWFW